jgi:hypothetical protein
MPMIRETMLTTMSAEGRVHIAPMGLIADGDSWIVAPFRPRMIIIPMASSSCCRKRPPRRAHSWNRTGARGRAIPAWSLLWTTQTTDPQVAARGGGFFQRAFGVATSACKYESRNATMIAVSFTILSAVRFCNRRSRSERPINTKEFSFEIGRAPLELSLTAWLHLQSKYSGNHTLLHPPLGGGNNR